MKIGLVIPNTPGYSETFFRSKIKGLQEKGFAVHLYCQQKKDDFNLCPVFVSPQVVSNPLLQGAYFIKEFLSLLPYVPTLVRYIKLERKEKTDFLPLIKKTYLNAHLLKAKLDWLHFGFATQALGSENVAKVIGAKMAVSFRGFDINVYPLKHPKAYLLVWKRVDRVHSISNYLLEKAYTFGLSQQTPYQIITPAVAMQNVPDRGVSSKSVTSIQLTTVARLHYIKGIDMLLETAALLDKQGINFTWNIIGGGTKKDTERYLYHRYQLGLENRVHFIGKKNHQETLHGIANSDIYVQTSLIEGFCNAVLEAQACGVLSIAFATGGLPENIVNGQTGFLAEGVSAGSLSNKIIEVLELNEEEKETISKQAVSRVKKQYSLEVQQQAFNTFYSN